MHAAYGIISETHDTIEYNREFFNQVQTFHVSGFTLKKILSNNKTYFCWFAGNKFGNRNSKKKIGPFESKPSNEVSELQIQCLAIRDASE